MLRYEAIFCDFGRFGVGILHLHTSPYSLPIPPQRVLDLTVFSWLQDYVDHMKPITRKDIVLAVLKGWEEMPESVILNAYSHLPTVHKGIVERRGGNRVERGT